MSEMIERVARALWKQERDSKAHSEPFRLSWYEDAARAAITAMRHDLTMIALAGLGHTNDIAVFDRFISDSFDEALSAQRAPLEHPVNAFARPWR